MRSADGDLHLQRSGIDQYDIRGLIALKGAYIFMHLSFHLAACFIHACATDTYMLRALIQMHLLSPTYSRFKSVCNYPMQRHICLSSLQLRLCIDNNFI